MDFTITFSVRKKELTIKCSYFTFDPIKRTKYGLINQNIPILLEGNVAWKISRILDEPPSICVHKLILARFNHNVSATK